MIHKYQQGGPSIFVQYNPFTAARATSSSVNGESSSNKSSSDEDKGKLTEKDLFTMIKELDGLPADMGGVINNISRLLDLSKFTDSKDLSTIYLKALQQIRTATYYKKQYDDAYKQVTDNTGINEYAITEQGKIVVSDKEGNIKAVDYNTLKDSSDLTILTNMDLLNIRAHNPKYANDQSFLNVINNGIGLEKINKLIKDALYNLSSNEYSTSGYVKREQGQITEGIQFLQREDVHQTLQAGTSIDGVYHAKISSKDNIKQAQAAINYIKSILPNNAKSLLKFKTDGTEKGLDTIIGLLVGQQAFSEYHTDLTLSNTKNSDSSEKDENGISKKMDDLTPVIGFVSGKGGIEDVKFLNIAKNSTPIVVNTRTFPLTSNNKSLDAKSTFNDLQSSDYNSILNLEQATFGGHLLTGDKSKVMLNESKITRVDLPIDQVAKEEKGIIRPDVSLTEKINEAEQYIKDHNIIDEAEINKVYNGMNIPIKYVKNSNNKWVINEGAWGSFAMINAKVDESAISNADISMLTETFVPPEILDGRIVEEMSDEHAINEVVEVFSNNAKSAGGKYTYNDPWKINPFSTKTKIYQGYLFIPIDDNIIAASWGDKNPFQVQKMEATEAFEKHELLKRYKPAQELGGLK